MTGLSVIVAPDDILSGTITFNPTTQIVNVTMTDVTHSETGSVGDRFSGFSPTFAGWVIGNGGGALAEFPSPITFSGGTVVDHGSKLKISQLSSLTELVMVDSSGYVMAEPSALATTGTAFSITWVSST